MVVSFLRRLKGKSVRDFVVYFRRKYFLQYVQFMDRYYSSKYFFSKSYLRKFIEDSYLFQHEIIHPDGGLFGDINSIEKRLLKWKAQYPEKFQFKLKQANKYLEHEFDLLGSGPVNLSFPCSPAGIKNIKYNYKATYLPNRDKSLSAKYRCIDWHIDFRSGYRWKPDEYYPSSRSYSLIEGADIKNPWELSRCQHLPLLSLTYLLTKEEKYAQEVYDVITDWISNNPLCKGPNWNCPMDVGIRVSNWFVALELLRQYKPSNIEVFSRKFLCSAVQHFDYLRNNFEWTSKLTSNHYLSDIAGFTFCTQYIPGLKSRSKFTEFARKELILELSKQMHSDGMNSEGSLYYHRLVLELFSYTALLKSGEFFTSNSESKENLLRCFEFTKEVIRPDNTFPQIGDNDSGLFLKLYPSKLNDARNLLCLGAKLFPDDGFDSCIESNSIESAIFNLEPVLSQNQLVKNIKIFKTSGLAIVKHKDTYLSFYFGLNGQKGNGGHCHNDRLSFTLWYKGKEIFTDPGTGFYTSLPKMRNFFRSTLAHNTVAVCGKEQNRFFDDGYLFGVKEDIKNTKFSYKKVNEYIEFNASHDGYNRLGKDVIHARKLRYYFEDGLIIINDSIGNDVEGIANFISKEKGSFELIENCVDTISYKLKVNGAQDLNASSFPYSHSYGELQTDRCIKISAPFEGTLKTEIQLK